MQKSPMDSLAFAADREKVLMFSRGAWELCFYVLAFFLKQEMNTIILPSTADL
jgi:hypothetical protein